MLPYGLDQNLTLSPAMNQIPPNMSQITPNMNQIPPNMNQMPPTQQSMESMTPNLYGLLNQQMPMNSAPSFRNPPTSQFTGMTPTAHPTPAVVSAPSQPTTTPVFNKAFNNTPVEKGPPLNVVITSSDPLPPSFKITQTQSPMVITIPPEHIKSAAPKSTVTAPVEPVKQTTPLFAPKATSNEENKSSFSFKMTSMENNNLPNMSDPKPFTFKMTTQEDKTPTTPAPADSTLDKSSNSNYEEDAEYDPRPDFKPIIPLPDEIDVKTGEEDEECLFSNRAKLFRHCENEWKERGIGIIKILKNKENKCRILMRREQIHKICANHAINSEMVLTVPDKEKKGFIWVANDFAEEVLSKEKFFVRFKNAEIANEFFNVFKKAAETSVPTPVKQDPPPKSTPAVVPTLEKKTFSFNLNKQDSTSTPNKENAAPSPFANLNFGQSPASTTGTSPFGKLFAPKTDATAPAPAAPQVDLNKSEEPDEYVPTAEFAPVIPLPDLVEVVTGEENDNVLYVHRAKLLRFDKASNEWKERGIGDIKILQNISDLSKVRLVMRREVIHKLCCNQRIYKDTDFKFHPNSKKAVMWVGQDYSENELAIETLTLRFKTEEICADFMKAIKNAQSYIAAEQEDNDDDTESENVSYSDNNSSDIVADPTLASTQGFGDKFKTKAGSWNCEACYVQNDGNSTNCLACNTPKEKPSKPAAPKPVNNGPPLTSGFGDKFKPAAGSWTCKGCYLSNPGSDLYCKACEAPKDDTVPKKEPKSLVLEKPKTTFTFGFAAANSATTPSKSTDVKKPETTVPFGVANTTPSAPVFGFTPQNNASTPSFSFGKPTETTVSTSSTPTFNFATPAVSNTPASANIFSTPTASATTPAKPTFTFNMPGSAENSTSFNSKEFSFQLKPKSPGKFKSPLKGNEGSDVEDDSEIYEEEENNTYFTPVIPLPDKVCIFLYILNILRTF